MTDEIDPRVIKKTQDLLGKIIKKPPLNEKLLRKPPFRFLHDIVTNVIKVSGFFEGLYSSDELLSENVKDKEKKTGFLQKAIDVTIMVTGENLTVKPSKIVSGHEPQKTNEFLQAIGNAILEKKDSTEAVQKVLNGEKPNLPLGKKRSSDPSEKGKRRESVNKESKSNTEKASRSNEPKIRGSVKNATSDQNKSRDRNKTKERGGSKDRLRLKTREQTVEQNKVSSPPKAKPTEKGDEILKENPPKIKGENVPVSLDGDKENNSVTNSPAHILNNELKEDKDASLELQNLQTNKPAASPPQSVTRPASAVRVLSARPKPVSPVAKAKTPELEPPNETSQPSSSRPVRSALKSARPSSARPAPPKIRIRHIVENEEQIRQPSAKPVANVILDTKENSDNEDDTFITEEPSEPSVIDNSPVPSTPLNVEEEPQGSLVKQLLETKKDLEGGSQQIPTKKTEIDKSMMNDAARKRERESIGKELEHLRSFIQTVSRSANPLGKILDYLQEDIDSMQQELKMWQDEHQQNLIALSREESVTENALDPLRLQLEELDQTVQDQSDSISTLKASILRNDERIHRMLAAVNQPVHS